MLKITPQYNVYKNRLDINTNNKSNNESKFIGMAKPINLNHQVSANNMLSFEGYAPSAKNRYMIKKIVDLVKSEEIKKIALLSHVGHDGDKIGSMLGLKNIIKKATNKKADAFILNPLPLNTAFIDPKKEIKVIKNIFEGPEKPQLQLSVTPEQIRRKFGDYDLVIVTDTALKSLIDKELKESILDHAKMTAKIDHHPHREGMKAEDFRYGDINLIDPSQESASQIIMQFVKPFGLAANSKISDPISMGMITDSGQFAYARGKNIFKDASLLSKTSDLKKIAELVKKLDHNEFQLYKTMMNSIKFNNDGEIAYFITDQANVKSPIKSVVVAVLDQISKIHGVKYYFSVIKNSPESGKICSSIRSMDKPIGELAEELGGGGHDYVCGLSKKEENAERFANEVLTKLIELKNS